MFFIVTRRETVALSPRDFGRGTQQKILRELRMKVQGKVSPKYGYTILVMKLMDSEQKLNGVIDPDTGHAHYSVDYYSLVLRPFNGEVMIAEVRSISQQGFFCAYGPLEVFVSSHNMAEHFEYDTSTGQQSFVVRSDDTEPGDDYERRLQINSLVRVRILGLCFTADSISCIGTIKDNYLGPID